MLYWWRSRGIDRVDIAVRRRSGAMIWHPELRPERLPLAWLRAENARAAEVYIRPARARAWPLVFLDDVEPERALATARKYAALIVKTSPSGGAHLWLLCARPLGERERAAAQKWLAAHLDADPASTSGEHLGRLAGFRNWKRQGVWVNVLLARAPESKPPWDPAAALGPQAATGAHAAGRPPPVPPRAATADTSPSGQEWAWVLCLLEAGTDPDDVYRRLLERARPRRGHDAERYARRTLENALRYRRAT